MIKSIVKSVVETAAGTVGWEITKRGNSRLLILMYHRILPLTDTRYAFEEPGMVVTDETFRMHMQVLQNEKLPVVSVSQWVSMPTEERPPLAVAITFDDGWLDNYEFAFPVLKEFGYPATLYVVSDFLGQPAPFWPNRVLQLVMSHDSTLNDEDLNKLAFLAGYKPELPLTRDEAAHLITSLKKRTDAEIYAFLAGLPNRADKPVEMISDTQLLHAMEQFNIEVGCHTRRHLRLTDALSSAQLQEEIVESKNILACLTGSAPTSFCFPNGDYSDAALKLVQDNYGNAVTTQRGINNSKSFMPHQLVRVGLHNDVSSTPLKFKARLSRWV